jgi:hypothetical protein
MGLGARVVRPPELVGDSLWALYLRADSIGVVEGRTV